MFLLFQFCIFRKRKTMSKTKNYSNNDVTIVWEPQKCIHSAICVKGLPDVFKPKEKPWITANGATTEKIIAQVKKCPSGALSYFMNEEEI